MQEFKRIDSTKYKGSLKNLRYSKNMEPITSTYEQNIFKPDSITKCSKTLPALSIVTLIFVISAKKYFRYIWATTG